jgi:hypothetical protein
MAASNAHFWVGNSWDSSEEMMMRSRRFCTRVPRHPYVDPLSASAVQTLIVTLQGAQALCEVIGTVSVYSKYSVNVNLGTVFLPLAIFGLLRLPAALWMSVDSAYANEDIMEVPAMSFAHDKDSSEIEKLEEAGRLAPPMRLLVEPEDEPAAVRFSAANGTRGIATRIIYLAAILALTGFTMYNAFPPPSQTYLSATSFTQILFFLFFLLATTFIFIFYFLRRDSTTTIIPCLTSTWYKLYTALLFLGMLILIIIAAIETRKTWCGVWTTYPQQVPGLPGAEFSYCPFTFDIKASELSWTWNNGTSNRTELLSNFDGLVWGNWTSSRSENGLGSG